MKQPFQTNQIDHFKALTKAIGYEFNDLTLIGLAITHRSVHSSKNNERLEFLGDSILNFVIGDALFNKFSDAKEGQLSRLRSELVRGTTLAAVAKELDLGPYVLLGPGELKSGGHRRESILADLLEAIIGAIYLDGGMPPCKERIHHWFGKRLDRIDSDISKDPKTRLQEYLQSRRLPLPNYTVKSINGEPHAQIFEVSCEVNELGIKTDGTGSSRRKAEQQAANRLLAELVE